MLLDALAEKWPIADRSKLQLFLMNTPNGMKISIALEELGLPYEAHTVNIMAGDQFDPGYVQLSPNSKIPALVDPTAEGAPLAIMESGAILLHLAESTGRLLPTDPTLRSEAIQWLFFQVGHVGPMFGQYGHFLRFAGEKCEHPYPLDRYRTESKRLLGVLDARLADRAFLAETYSIADIAIFPWVNTLIGFYKATDDIEFATFKNVARWLETCTDRPAFARAKDVGSIQ